jgi:hypothetical protein
MSQEFQLPDELYSELRQAAETEGTTPVEWVAARLAERKARSAEDPVQLGSLADLFVGKIGLFDSRDAAASSEKGASAFTQYLEDKRRAGHL